MLIEFRVARASWERWHDHTATEDEQRNYGRRWRWTRVWETVWDRWVAQGKAQSLAEFIEDSAHFWRALVPYLDDPTEYDPAIEIIWEETLARGPSVLGTWGKVVPSTWAALAARVIAEAERNAAPSPGTTVPVIPEATGRKPSLLVVTGQSTTDALLMQWQRALREQGYSSSRAGNLRRYVVRALQHNGNDWEALDATQGDRETNLAIGRFQTWVNDHTAISAPTPRSGS